VELLTPAVASVSLFVESGHAAPEVREPLYAFALSVRALTAEFAIDYPELDSERRTERREMLERAGRKLMAWQHADGGFGYSADDPRTDSSCTLFAAMALADLRVSGVLDTRAALIRAGDFLEARMRDDGILDYRLARDRDGDLALTAAALALHRDLGLETRRRPGLLAVKRALHGFDGTDALLLASGAEAFRRHRVPITEPVEALVRAQRENGSWDGKLDRHLRQGGDELATAFAVIGLSRTYVN
jgi:hypothetical protein